MTAKEKYKALIKYRSKHKLEKGHKHHIIPRCMTRFLYNCLALIVCGDLLAFDACFKLKLQDESIIDILL